MCIISWTYRQLEASKQSSIIGTQLLPSLSNYDLPKYIHLNEFLIGHYIKSETYLINASKVRLLCIVHTNLSNNGKKKSVFMYKIVHVER